MADDRHQHVVRRGVDDHHSGADGCKQLVQTLHGIGVCPRGRGQQVGGADEQALHGMLGPVFVRPGHRMAPDDVDPGGNGGLHGIDDVVLHTSDVGQDRAGT